MSAGFEINDTPDMPTKDAGLYTHIERDFRGGFLEACRAQDWPVSQVIHEFMWECIAERKADT